MGYSYSLIKRKQNLWHYSLNFEVTIKERTGACQSLLKMAWAGQNTDPLPGIKPLNQCRE